jgi:hypothetical protein
MKLFSTTIRSRPRRPPHIMKYMVTYMWFSIYLNFIEDKYEVMIFEDIYIMIQLSIRVGGVILNRFWLSCLCPLDLLLPIVSSVV